MALRGEKIAVLGDLHGKWNQRDTDFFDSAGFDLLIFVGDLGSGTRASEREVVKRLASLDVPILVMPGNNDAHFIDDLRDELGAPVSLRGGQGAASGVCGYSTHVVDTGQGAVTIVGGRPCAMGGSEFSFGRHLERTFGVTGLEHSAGRLKRLVDECKTDSIVFVSHNGPFGLGGDASSPWARDFMLPEELEHAAPRDWGDRDLEEAITYAIDRGKDVVASVAGHMHRSPRGGRRPLITRHRGVAHINAAMVPRIIPGEVGERHHYLEFTLRLGAPKGQRIEVREVWRELAAAPVSVRAPTASSSLAN